MVPGRGVVGHYIDRCIRTNKLLVKMCVNINLGISSGTARSFWHGLSGQGVLKHPEHHARHATGRGMWLTVIINIGFMCMMSKFITVCSSFHDIAQCFL